MHLYAIMLFYKKDPSKNKSTVLKTTYELSAVRSHERVNFQKLIFFAAKSLVDKATSPSRVTVMHDSFCCHGIVQQDFIGGVIVADRSYPPEKCFTLILNILAEFKDEVPRHLWSKVAHNPSYFSKMDGYALKYQDPACVGESLEARALRCEQQAAAVNTAGTLLDIGDNETDSLLSKAEQQANDHYNTFLRVGQTAGGSAQSDIQFAENSKCCKCCSIL